MDLLHLFLAIGMVMQLAALGFIVWGAVNIAYTTAQVEETAKDIAQMVSRDEKMIQSILQKVYDVSRPQA